MKLKKIRQILSAITLSFLFVGLPDAQAVTDQVADGVSHPDL